MKLFGLSLIVVLTGCSGAPFIEGAVGYSVSVQEFESARFPEHHHHTCRGATQLKAGFEYDSYSIGFAHDSHWDCGKPLNNKKEFYRDYLYISKKWGGK